MVSAIPQAENPLPGFAPNMDSAIAAYRNGDDIKSKVTPGQPLAAMASKPTQTIDSFDAKKLLSTELYATQPKKETPPDTVNMEQMLAQAERIINAELQTIRNEMGQLSGNIDRGALSAHEGQLLNAQADVGRMLEYLKSIREGRAISIHGVFNPARALDNLQRLIVDKLKLTDDKTNIFATNDHLSPPSLTLQHLMMLTLLGLNLAIKHEALMQGIEIASQVYGAVQDVQAGLEDFNFVVEHAKAAAAAAEEEQKTGRIRKTIRKVFHKRSEAEKKVEAVEAQIEMVLKDEAVQVAAEHHTQKGENVESAEVKKAVMKEAEALAKQRKQAIVGKAKAVEKNECSLLDVYDEIIGTAEETYNQVVTAYETNMAELGQEYHQLPVFEELAAPAVLDGKPVSDISGDAPELSGTAETKKPSATQVAGAVTCSLFHPVAMQGFKNMLGGIRAQVAKASDSIAQNGFAGIGGKPDFVTLGQYLSDGMRAGNGIKTELSAQTNALQEKAATIERAQDDLQLCAARQLGPQEKRTPLETESLIDVYGAENAAQFASQQQLAQQEKARELEPQRQSIMDKFHAALQTVTQGRGPAVQSLGL